MQARVYDNVIEVEASVNTAAHAAADTVFQPIELPDITLAGGCAIITSVVLIDYDDQGAEIDILFFDQPPTVGANNAAFNLSDSDAGHVIGYVAVDDYLNLANNQIGQETNLGIVIKPTPNNSGAGRSVWIAGLTPDTPTYAGGRLTLKIGVLRG
jgi:hypothetical protein